MRPDVVLKLIRILSAYRVEAGRLHGSRRKKSPTSLSGEMSGNALLPSKNRTLVLLVA